MEPLLALEGVSAAYGPADVLRSISLRVHRGETVAILGANGAGKTTLIRSILSLVRVTSGEIRFEGRPITGRKTHLIHALGIGVVPEGKRLFPKMTVLENLRMGAHLERDEAVVRARIEQMMDLFPRLRERAHQLAGTMSGGEQSMLSIARGLMSNPKLLLMDEPSFGLAPVLVEEIFRLIRRINEAGTTILLVEQNAWQSLQVVHRGYILQKGEVILSGEARELLQNPEIQRAYLLA